jgi:hypothetical protein
MLAATATATTAAAYSPAPIPVLLMLCAILVGGFVAGVLAWKGRREAKPFACPKCGYDLRGSAKPGAVTCPECGSVYS